MSIVFVQNYLQLDQTTNLIPGSLKLLEENVGHTLHHDKSVRKDLLLRTPFPLELKPTIDKRIKKIKSVCIAEETITMEIEKPSDWERMLPCYISDRV